MNLKPRYSLPALGAAALLIGGFIGGLDNRGTSVSLIPSAHAAPAAPPAFARCAACHSSTRGAAPIVGPNLFGKFGATMGRDNFQYSRAVKESGLTLEEATLDKWIQNPRAVVPGNRMAFPGIQDAATRKSIIEYLKKLR